MTQRKGKQRRGAGRLAALTLALALALSLCPHALAAEDALSAAARRAADQLVQTVPAPQVGAVGGEWAVIGLARGGFEVPLHYWEDYYAAVTAQVKACGGVLHPRKYTEYSRVILALTAIGADPRDVAGYDLLVPLGDFERTIAQGVNGAAFALLALDAGEYEIPWNSAAATQATRQMYVDTILARQLPDGGWNLTGGDGAEADTTAMALQALAGYRKQAAVSAAVDRGLACLSGLQGLDGGFAAYGSQNTESIAQVVVALCQLGIPLEDARFVKNGATLVQRLLAAQLPNGSFCHQAEDAAGDLMATEQALYALAAVLRSASGRPALYCMGDAEPLLSGGTEPFPKSPEMSREILSRRACAKMLGAALLCVRLL